MQRGGAEASSRLNPGFRLSWSVLFSIARHGRRHRGGSLADGCRRGPGTSPRTGPDYSERDKEPPADKRPGRFFFFFWRRAAEPSPLGISMMSRVSGQQVGRRRLPESHNASQPPPPHPHIHLDPSRAEITLAAAARACLLFDSPNFLPLVQSLRGNNVQDSLQAQQ